MSRALRFFAFVWPHLLHGVRGLRRARDQRGGYLVFTHFQDMDRRGRDHQMGPLIEEIERRRIPWVEIARVPFRRSALARARQAKGDRVFFSHGLLLAAARILALPWWSEFRLWGAREAVARRLLEWLGPTTIFVIDESGSGQPFVRAGSALGILVIGVQHGDFQEDNLQYCSAARQRAGLLRSPAPVDRLCVWSEWFRSRLIAVSSIYDRENTVVTGRLRYDGGRTESPRSTPGDRGDGKRRVVVLLLGEAGPAWDQAVMPFCRALERSEEVELRVRPHPSQSFSERERKPRPHTGRDLAEDLLESDVAVGVGSSALLEAVFFGRPVVCFITSALGDSAGYVRDGVAEACTRPEEGVEMCVRLARQSGSDALQRRVWGDNSGFPASRILALAREPIARFRDD